MKKLEKEIWIVAAKRTPFGAMGGAFKALSATDLGVHAAKAALAQSGLEPTEIDHVVFGNVQQTSPDAIYCARHVGLKAGLPIEVPAITVNRLCGSGFQAVVTAAQDILVGDSKAVLCGGTENMSQAPHSVWGMREGARFGQPPAMVDTLWASLTDSYCKTAMAVTAENLAEKYGITREDCDTFALKSQQRWAAANESGGFADELPRSRKGRKGPVTVAVDEHPGRRPRCRGNASGICDGAVALVVCDEEWAKERSEAAREASCERRCRAVAHGHRPAPAIRSAPFTGRARDGQIDWFDVNEVSAQRLAVQREPGAGLRRRATRTARSPSVTRSAPRGP
ncbi:MAG: hypothetical protein R3B82_06550 [Sandaracinaceae bacterium]